MKERGVLVRRARPSAFRAVTHYGIARADIDRAVAAAAQAAGGDFRRLTSPTSLSVNRPYPSLLTEGHIGLVTGASSGLGVECATALAMAGADVALAARREDRAAETRGRTRGTYGVKAIGIGSRHHSSRPTSTTLVADAAGALGDVDILVNNAGMSPTGRAENFSRDDVGRGARGQSDGADDALAARRPPPDRNQAPGRIINMVSIYAIVASSIYRLSAYTATKAALANLTRQLAVEWAGYGILVNAIAPGWIPTEATEGGIAKRRTTQADGEVRRRWTARATRGNSRRDDFPGQRGFKLRTGSMISVDGGYQAW